MKQSDIVNLNFGKDQLLEKWDSFKTAFMAVSKKHVPKKSMRVKATMKPWIHNDVVKLIYERNYVKKCAVKTKNDALWKKYRMLRNKVTSDTREAKRKYFDEKINECGNNVHKLWKCLNKIAGNKSFKQPHKDLDCTIFNEYFSTIGEKIVLNQQSSQDQNLPWKLQAEQILHSFKLKLNK